MKTMKKWVEAKIKFEYFSFIAGLRAHHMNKDFIPTPSTFMEVIQLLEVQTNKYYEMINQRTNLTMMVDA
jgi:hypothetical protein